MILSPQALVSVNMCVHNGGLYLHDTIRSVLGQTYQNFEFIIVDDGSTDDTVSIIRSYADPRIRLLQNEKNEGISASRNKCMEHSSGKYIAIQDADDISLPKRFERQVSFLETNSGISYCGGWMEYFGRRSGIAKYPNKYLKEMQLSNCMFGHPTVMFRRDILGSIISGFDAHYDPAQDYAFQAALIPKIAFANIQEILVRYRYHESNISTRHQLMLEKCRQVRESLFKQIFGVEKLLQEHSEQINDFFVRLQYFDHPTMEEQTALLNLMKNTVEMGSKLPYYTKRGLRSVMVRYYFKILLRAKNRRVERWLQFIKSGHLPYIFRVYSIRDILYLVRNT